jgi:hypothetical protein
MTPNKHLSSPMATTTSRTIRRTHRNRLRLTNSRT